MRESMTDKTSYSMDYDEKMFHSHSVQCLSEFSPFGRASASRFALLHFYAVFSLHVGLTLPWYFVVPLFYHLTRFRVGFIWCCFFAAASREYENENIISISAKSPFDFISIHVGITESLPFFPVSLYFSSLTDRPSAWNLSKQHWERMSFGVLFCLVLSLFSWLLFSLCLWIDASYVLLVAILLVTFWIWWNMDIARLFWHSNMLFRLYASMLLQFWTRYETDKWRILTAWQSVLAGITAPFFLPCHCL